MCAHQSSDPALYPPRPLTRRIATGVAVMGAAAAAVLLLVRGMKGRRRVPLGGESGEAYDPLQRWLTSPVIKTRS